MRNGRHAARDDLDAIDALPEVLDARPVAPSTREDDGSAELVLAEVRPLEPRREPGLPTPVVQAAAVAATTFVAGATLVAALHRRHTRKTTRRRFGSRRRDRVQVLHSRSFLVDVHLIAPRD